MSELSRLCYACLQVQAGICEIPHLKAKCSSRLQIDAQIRNCTMKSFRSSSMQPEKDASFAGASGKQFDIIVRKMRLYRHGCGWKNGSIKILGVATSIAWT